MQDSEQRFRSCFLEQNKRSYHFIEKLKTAAKLSAFSMPLTQKIPHPHMFIDGKGELRVLPKKILSQSYAVKQKQCFLGFH